MYSVPKIGIRLRKGAKLISSAFFLRHNIGRFSGKGMYFHFEVAKSTPTLHFLTRIPLNNFCLKLCQSEENLVKFSLRNARQFPRKSRFN